MSTLDQAPTRPECRVSNSPRLRFLREYARNIRTVGAVAPSSRYLARKMVQDIDFDAARLLVEYGPGSGVFTQELADRLHPDAHLLVIEANQTFHADLVARFGHRENISLVHGSAEDVRAELERIGHGRPIDHIVSGLPFAALPAVVSERILSEAVQALRPDGTFITFQYTPFKKALLQRHFSRITSVTELRNIPPAVIYRCQVG